jgi:3-hydroxybutyrate dehydrogenase
MSLKGKSAIVTGSTSGIGQAIAEAFAAQGCNVMLNGFGEPAAIARQREQMAKKNGVEVEYNGADMSKPVEITDLVARTKAAFGSVDILVNNAGIQFTAPVEQFPAEKWDAIIAVNLSATFHAIHAALPLMKARKWGRIVNIASTHGLVASANKAAYVAAKHGVVGLTKVVGIECADTGVTCNAICPGWVLTPLVQAQIEARAKAENITVEKANHDLLADKQPQVQFTRPDQIAGLALFLASDTASNMQGAELVSDGGWTAQ